MKSNAGKQAERMSYDKGEHTLVALPIDTGQDHLLYTCILCSLEHGLSIEVKLLPVDMCMAIDE